MIVKTNTGETVDLGQPENVRRGMVFRGGGRDFVAACDANFGITEFLGCHPVIARREDCERFGIPVRCEQHGVPDAPIDAGAHGFARTRDGFAVDFRRVHLPPGAIVGGSRGQRSSPASHFVGPLTETVGRFVGLDARHAHPEDVERLCCGAAGCNDGHGTNPVTGEPITLRAPRCTLAIGDHDEHEDIATGAKWSAKVALSRAGDMRDKFMHDAVVSAVRMKETLGEVARHDRIAREVALTGDLDAALKWSPEVAVAIGPKRNAESALPKATVEFGEGFGAVTLALNLRATSLAADGSRTFTLNGTLSGGSLEQARAKSIFYMATAQNEEVRLYHRGETIRALLLDRWTSQSLGSDGVEVSVLLREVREQAKETPRGGFATELAGASWTSPEMSPGALHIHGGGRHWMKLTADGILSCSCGSAKEHTDNCDVPAWARADADVGLRVLRDGGTLKEAGDAVMARVERRKREAGLVELVNAVPEGLDPVGWRAAVLAAHEAKNISAVNREGLVGLLELDIKTGMTDGSKARAAALSAYRRAIAPHKSPPPERKQRGPRLTVDDGRDE